MQKRIKLRYIILAIFILFLLGIGICLYLDNIYRNWSLEFEKQLPANSVWKYENSENNFEIELLLSNTSNHFIDNSVNYVCDDRSGKWILALSKEYKAVEVGYSIKNVFFKVWGGKIKYENEKIVISEIVKFDDISSWIEKGWVPEKYAKDTVPQGIETIELKRVKTEKLISFKNNLTRFCISENYLQVIGCGNDFKTQAYLLKTNGKGKVKLQEWDSVNL